MVTRTKRLCVCHIQTFCKENTAAILLAGYLQAASIQTVVSNVVIKFSRKSILSKKND